MKFIELSPKKVQLFFSFHIFFYILVIITEYIYNKNIKKYIHNKVILLTHLVDLHSFLVNSPGNWPTRLVNFGFKEHTRTTQSMKELFILFSRRRAFLAYLPEKRKRKKGEKKSHRLCTFSLFIEDSLAVYGDYLMR